MYNFLEAKTAGQISVEDQNNQIPILYTYTCTKKYSYLKFISGFSGFSGHLPISNKIRNPILKWLLMPSITEYRILILVLTISYFSPVGFMGD